MEQKHTPMAEYLKQLRGQQEQIQHAKGVLGDFFAGNITEDQMRERIYGGPGAPKTEPKTAQPWRSLEEMNAALQQLPQRPAPPRPNVPDPAARRAEIERELDIIKGRIATPPGYTVDPKRAKALMAELKQLGN